VGPNNGVRFFTPADNLDFMSEADIHFEFYRHLQNAIENEPERGGREYDTISPEYGENIDGFADLAIFDTTGECILIVEAKRPSDTGEGRRNIDPYSPKVIRQAHDYASQVGSPYFATFNGDRLVLFRTFEEGVPLLQRSTKSYDISGLEKFSDTILDEIERLEEGERKWDSLDDAFIQRVKSLHEKVSPQMQRSVGEYLGEDEDFRNRFVQWMSEQGTDFDDLGEDEREEELENFAEQATYLLINKIIFYKILENSEVYSDDVRPLAVSINRVREDLKEYFDEVVERVDFEAIFEHDDIYSEIPLDNVNQRIREFIIELEDEDLTRFNSDVVGRIYEGVIPPERRHDMGEYYTPPSICDLITRLTIDDPHDTVFDPACGSGGFLVSAYNRKKELFAESTGTHSTVLDELYGVDINRFPAHLTAINLAIQNLSEYTDNVNVEVNDFFDVTPDTMRFGKEKASAEGGETEKGMVDTLGGFDAVVGNPPYIRQENIDDKEKVRSHLSRVKGEGLSKRSDIYSYFITHGTEFLDEKGKLGMIVSDRWLDTGYGADLQEFLLDNYAIEFVIKFDKQTFEDALVGSTVLILQKLSKVEKRNSNTVNFLRIKRDISVDELISVLDEDAEKNKMIRTEEYRIVTKEQSDLYDEEKWNLFFMSPPIYFDTISHEKVSELQEFTNVNRGVTTGANKFFCGRTEEMDDLGLTEYTIPLLKASGQVDKIRFTEEDAEEWSILYLDELVQEATEDMEGKLGQSAEEGIKQWLKGNGHEDLLEYIYWGEEQGFHERATCSSRDVWFNLGSLKRPPMFNPDFTWKEHRVVWNDADAVAVNQFHNIETDESVADKLCGGILNSRLIWMYSELNGRTAGGQGMTRSRIAVYEFKELPVPDPREMSEEESERIISAFEDLMDKEEELDEDAPLEAKEGERDALDRAVLSTIDMEDRLDDLKRAVRGLVEMREKGAGDETEVLVEREEEREVIDLEGVSQARESTTLGDFD
jgi:type I restriction-modification system DNA methylase subunit